VWPVATYGAEAWTYRKEGWKRWLAFETTGYRRAMRIPWEAKQTNDEVLRKAGGRQLPGMLVKRKLQYFGHLMRKTTDNLEKDIITGSIPGSRRRGGPPRAWINDITDWTDLSTNKVLQMVWDRKCWRDVVHRAAKVRNDE